MGCIFVGVLYTLILAENYIKYSSYDNSLLLSMSIIINYNLGQTARIKQMLIAFDSQ